MTTKKIMVVGISFALAAMLLSSGNVLNASFAQNNIVDQTNTVDQTNGGGGDNNNSNRQNYDDFQNCLDGEAGTTGFATEQQIRDCFAPIYIGDDSNNNDSNNNDSNNNDSNNNDSNN
jgi:hypothetical protein